VERLREENEKLAKTVAEFATSAPTIPDLDLQ
jgi:hypothetical protein